MAARPFAKRVMYDGLYTFVLRMINVACAAGLGIVTARLLGPAGKGIYALPSVQAGLVVAAFTGLSSSMSYFLLNRPNARMLRPTFIAAGLFCLAGALFVVAIAYFGKQQWAALPAIAFLPSAAAINIAVGYTIGIKKVRYSSSITVANTVITFVFMLAGLFLVARTPAVAIAAWIASNALLAVGVLAAIVFRARKTSGNEHVGSMEFLSFAVRAGLVNLVSLLNYRADLYMIALMTSAATLGMYTVAISAAESLLIPTQVAALVTSPHIGSLEVREAAQLTARCIRNNLLIALTVCGLLWVLATPVIGLLYGAAFLKVVPALRVLLVGVAALALGSPISSYFTLKRGKPELALSVAGASAFICIAVSIALIPRLGMVGAALGSTAAYILGQTFAVWYFARTSKLDTRTILLPTLSDFRLYGSFLARLFRDGQRLLRLRPTRPGNSA